MKPTSLSHFLDLCEKIKAKAKTEVDTAIWWNKNTAEILKQRFPTPTGHRAYEAQLDLARHVTHINFYIDDTLEDGVIESGEWIRLREFEEGFPGYRKLVRHRQTI